MRNPRQSQTNSEKVGEREDDEKGGVDKTSLCVGLGRMSFCCGDCDREIVAVGGDLEGDDGT